MAIRIPITNYYGGGDYTAAIQIGSRQAIANVILDTGSSTLAVKQSTYNPLTDAALRPTSLVQDITYGTGGWAGPLVTTKLAMGQAADMAKASAAIAYEIDRRQRSFQIVSDLSDIRGPRQ